MTSRTDPAHPVASPTCSPAVRVTGALLGYGILAGPVYVLTSLVQVATRTGFDSGRHSWSQLALGDTGWVQVTNFLLTGLLVTAGAVGLGRSRSGSAWGARLIGVFGLSLIVAGLFRVDAVAGFPAGLAQPATVGTAGLVHLAAGGIGFLALVAGLLSIARGLRADDSPRTATACRIVAPLFLVAFLVMASGASGPVGNLVFTGGVVAVFGVLSLVCSDRFRRRTG